MDTCEETVTTSDRLAEVEEPGKRRLVRLRSWEGTLKIGLDKLAGTKPHLVILKSCNPVKPFDKSTGLHDFRMTLG
jgi:hypothetical protein